MGSHETLCRAFLLFSLALSAACQSGAPDSSSERIARVEQEVLEQAATGTGVDVIVTLKGDDSLRELDLAIDRRAALVSAVTERALAALGADRARVRWHGRFVPELSLRVDRSLVDKLARLPLVESVTLDQRVYAMLAQGAPLIGASSTWLHGVTGAGQTVAVLDTGVDYTHPALGGGFGNKVVAGYDFVNDDADPMDDEGHGTGVAGIVASSDATRRGVAPDAKLVALKVLDQNGQGTFSAIDRALEWILMNAATYGISVANLSFGTDSVYANSAVCNGSNTAVLMGLLRAQGIAVFVASGNSGCGTGISFPACASSAISVGAVYDAALGQRAFITANDCGSSTCVGNPNPLECCVDTTTAAGKVTCYTNSSSLLDLLAPAHEATTTRLGGGFQSNFGGTSAATPYAAGAAALLLDLTNGALGPSGLETTLKSTGSLRTDPKNSLSFPLIDVFQAARSVNPCFGEPDGTPCDDGDACTAEDSCEQNECQGGAPADCDDDNPCTDDRCDQALGCASEPNEAPCSDGSACTEGDVCHDGACVASAVVACPDDQHPCTESVCDPASGCRQLFKDELCDDGNPCTDDRCGSSGCEHSPNAASCDDGLLCTVDDRCDNGVCVGQASACDDGNPCTLEICDADSGACQVQPHAVQVASGEGHACFGDRCEATPAGDGCRAPITLSLGVPYEGDLAGHHELVALDETCTRGEELRGADSLHSITLAPGEYDVTLSTPLPKLDLAFAIKTSCDTSGCSRLANATTTGTEKLGAWKVEARSTFVIQVKALSRVEDAAPYTLSVRAVSPDGSGEGGAGSEGTGPGDGGEGQRSSAKGDRSENSGCSCRAATGAPTSWSALSFPLLALLRRRRRVRVA
jgi:subtilisin family serine protease